MSSILKALRKLESDKSALGEGSVDIGRDILKRSYQASEERPRGTFLLVAAVAVAVAGVGGVWLLGQDSSVADSPPVARQVVDAVPAAPPEPETSIPPTAIDLPLPTSKPPTRSVAADIPEPSAVVAAVPASQKTGGSLKAVPPVPLVIPELQVEEIVYQAEPEARLAVVNDLPVMEGTTLDNVQVVEILPDRVRFSIQGIQFEKTAAAKK
jgi:general secretion pathway protein B